MFRVLVLGVERLVARFAELRARQGNPSTMPMHVLLPLSPNHGTFGGDGAYGECKAALEVCGTSNGPKPMVGDAMRPLWVHGLVGCGAQV